MGGGVKISQIFLCGKRLFLDLRIYKTQQGIVRLYSSPSLTYFSVAYREIDRAGLL